MKSSLFTNEVLYLYHRQVEQWHNHRNHQKHYTFLINKPFSISHQLDHNYQMYKQCDNKAQKLLLIMMSYTVAQPRAMMVKPLYTPVT